jgi:signal transduction histidine kinase
VFRNKKPPYANWTLLLSEFNKSLTLITDLRQLKDNFIAKIKELVPVSNVIILLLNHDKNLFVRVKNETDETDEKAKTEEIYFLPGDKLIFWLEVNRKCLLVKEEPQIVDFIGAREQKMLLNNQIEYIYPFIVMNKVKGLVLLSKKHNGENILPEEQEVLNTLFNQAGFAFENALLYNQQKERIRKMYRADRLATLGELAAGTAHEIRNPLTSIRSTIQYLERKISDKNDKEMVHDLLGEVDRINEIISGMLSFSRPDKIDKEMVNLHETIYQVVKLVHNSAKRKNIEIDILYNTELKQIMADQGQLKQVLLNVIMNSIQAIESDHGKIMVTVYTSSPGRKDVNKAYPGYYLLEIADNGTGIPEEEIEHVFDPFYTTKPTGTGLGLSISYGIIHKHGGEIEIESVAGERTTVRIKLPTNEA